MSNVAELNKKALLVNLNISAWTARRYDKVVTQEVAANHNTSVKVGRYNKNLLPVDCPEFSKLNTTIGETRKAYYEQTLPWLDRSGRILPAKNFMICSGILRQKNSEFTNAVDEFVQVYPGVVSQSLAMLNGLATLIDYPKPHDIKSYFSFELKFFPMPDKEDFRVDLQSETVDAIKAQIEQSTQEALAGAMRDLFTRLHTVVAAMATALTEPDKRFHDTLVSNIEKVCSIVPELNLTEDTELDALCNQIKNELVVSPDTLRESPVYRQQIAAQAKAIETKLADYAFLK